MYAIERSLPSGYISDVCERSQTISVEDEGAKTYIPDIAVTRERLEQLRRRYESGGGTALATPAIIPFVDETVEIEENYIEIYKMPDRELVTAIEVLSPWNKNGSGITVFQSKRNALLKHGVHVVELDLLRSGRRISLARPLPTGHYYAMIFRADHRPDVEVYGWSMQQAAPEIAIPLREPDDDIRVNLNTVLETVYDRGRYDRKLRYELPLPPPCTEEEQAWASERVSEIVQSRQQSRERR